MSNIEKPKAEAERGRIKGDEDPPLSPEFVIMLLKSNKDAADARMSVIEPLPKSLEARVVDSVVAIIKEKLGLSEEDLDVTASTFTEVQKELLTHGGDWPDFSAEIRRYLDGAILTVDRYKSRENSDGKIGGAFFWEVEFHSGIWYIPALKHFDERHVPFWLFDFMITKKGKEANALAEDIKKQIAETIHSLSNEKVTVEKVLGRGKDYVVG